MPTRGESPAELSAGHSGSARLSPNKAASARAAPATDALPTGTSSTRWLPAARKAAWLEAARLSLGRTALCLSGGGALAMLHMGLIRALLHRNAMPRVVSGTSGGSIVAAMLACKTDKEMMSDVIRDDIASRKGVRWFEPLPHQLATFLYSIVASKEEPRTEIHHGSDYGPDSRSGGIPRGASGGIKMVETTSFERTCKAYFGDTTFAQAYRRTRRAVSITVTIRYAQASTAHPMLLNYHTTPDVFLWSAVAASCALPGLMRPTRLMARDAVTGKAVPYHPGGVEAMDGSMVSDIPVDQLASLFHVRKFVVSQVNPHVAAFLRDEGRVSNPDNSWGGSANAGMDDEDEGGEGGDGYGDNEGNFLVGPHDAIEAAARAAGVGAAIADSLKAPATASAGVLRAGSSTSDGGEEYGVDDGIIQRKVHSVSPMETPSPRANRIIEEAADARSLLSLTRWAELLLCCDCGGRLGHMLGAWFALTAVPVRWLLGASGPGVCVNHGSDSSHDIGGNSGASTVATASEQAQNRIAGSSRAPGDTGNW